MQSTARIQSNTTKLPGNCTPICNSVSIMMGKGECYNRVDEQANL